MEQVLQLVVVFFAALATGGLMVNWIGLGRAMSRLSVSTYVEFHQATNFTFDPYMPIVVVGALSGGIVPAIPSIGFHSLSGELAIAGFVCYAAVIAIALATTSGSTNRSHAGQFRARPMTGGSFAPVGFDFTLSALSFLFQHWPATFLLVFSMDDLAMHRVLAVSPQKFTLAYCTQVEIGPSGVSRIEFATTVIAGVEFDFQDTESDQPQTGAEIAMPGNVSLAARMANRHSLTAERC